MKTANIMVWDEGVLEIGTPANPISASVNAEVVIADQKIDRKLDPAELGNGIEVLGRLTMHGAVKLPTFLRLARGTALAITTEEYIESARSLGCSPVRIAVRHVLPNILPPLLIQSSLTAAAAIIAEASLSFLGLGQQPPAPSWGSMLNAAQRYLVQAPWMAIYPGLVIFGVVMSLNVVGDALRDALDPKHQ